MGSTVFVVAIVAVGVLGLILILLTIAYPQLGDDESDQSVEPVRVSRRDFLTLGRRGRPATERRTERPSHLFAVSDSWEQGWRSDNAKLVAGLVAVCIAAGILIAHAA
jgi:hypothetical protein